MHPEKPDPSPVNRRQFLRDGARLAALTSVGGLLGLMAGKSTATGMVWQIDPTEVRALRQLRDAMRARAVGREMRARLRDLRLLPALHRLL